MLKGKHQIRPKSTIDLRTDSKTRMYDCAEILTSLAVTDDM